MKPCPSQRKITRVRDKGLITTKDDGPWHMLRRKGVP